MNDGSVAPPRDRVVVTGRIALRAGEQVTSGLQRPLRVARTLALAHAIGELIRDGSFVDQADAARALGFTRARMTQLLDLTMLVPEIQEEIMFTAVTGGRDIVSEHMLRRIVSASSWSEQRLTWAQLRRGAPAMARRGGMPGAPAVPADMPRRSR